MFSNGSLAIESIEKQLPQCAPFDVLACSSLYLNPTISPISDSDTSNTFSTIFLVSVVNLGLLTKNNNNLSCSTIYLYPTTNLLLGIAVQRILLGSFCNTYSFPLKSLMHILRAYKQKSSLIFV